MKTLLLRLLERLEHVGDDHEELFDSDVREKMRDVVTEGFLAPVPGIVIPENYLMYFSLGDKQACVVHSSGKRTQALGLESFHQRLTAFQDSDVETERQSTYDEFFVRAKPEEYNDEGLFLGRQ